MQSRANASVVCLFVSHHAARQRGAVARQRARPDQHSTLTSNAVMDKLTFVRLVSAVVPR